MKTKQGNKTDNHKHNFWIAPASTRSDAIAIDMSPVQEAAGRDGPQGRGGEVLLDRLRLLGRQDPPGEGPAVLVQFNNTDTWLVNYYNTDIWLVHSNNTDI